MNRLHRILLATCAVAASSTLAAAPKPSLPIPIRSHSLRSTVLGEAREVWVSLPDGYLDSQERYPVVYMLDGEINFNSGTLGGVRQAAQSGEIPEFIVVGIPNTDRGKDIFPEKVTYRDGTSDGGRANEFLAFIETELIPFIESEYRTERYRVLYGTSNTGFTAVYGLFHSPALADTVIAASATLGVPSFQRSLETTVRAFPDGRRRLILVMGEHDLPTVVSLNGALAETVAMAAPAGLTCRLAVISDGEHVPVTSLVEGLRLAFAGWKLTERLDEHTFAEVRAQVDARAARFGVPSRIAEDALRELAGSLLSEKKPAPAAEVARYWTTAYPRSAGAQVALGDALRQLGQADPAAECYRKALALDPAHATAQARLRDTGAT
jgi:uncharacterized protein